MRADREQRRPTGRQRRHVEIHHGIAALRVAKKRSARSSDDGAIAELTRRSASARRPPLRHVSLGCDARVDLGAHAPLPAMARGEPPHQDSQSQQHHGKSHPYHREPHATTRPCGIVVGGASRARFFAVPADASLEALLTDARAAWPGVEIDVPAFVRHLNQQTSGNARDVRGTELYLAFACAVADPRAISHLEKAFFGQAARAVARIDPSAAFVDEVMQRLRQRVLVGSKDSLPKIASFQGRGSLAHWVRAAALGIALDLRRERKNHGSLGDDDRDFEAGHPTPDPELGFIRERYRMPFKVAFARSLDALDSEERNVLRLHLLNGLTLGQVAALLQVHRATATRWYARARQRLLDELRRDLGERLKMNRDEVDSLTRVMRSQLDVSIGALLKTM
jgi:RNA polymerase sigma-70 factor, ECF subfamily